MYEQLRLELILSHELAAQEMTTTRVREPGVWPGFRERLGIMIRGVERDSP